MDGLGFGGYPSQNSGEDHSGTRHLSTKYGKTHSRTYNVSTNIERHTVESVTLTTLISSVNRTDMSVHWEMCPGTGEQFSQLGMMACVYSEG